MLKCQLLKTPASVVACAALLLLGISIIPSSGRADNDNNGSQDEKRTIQIGLSVASSDGIQLNVAGKDSDMVGLGSYFVNVYDMALSKSATLETPAPGVL